MKLPDRQLLDVAPDAMFVVDKSGGIDLIKGSASPQCEDGVSIATRIIFHNVTVHRKA
jgi:hypothetical protein